MKVLTIYARKDFEAVLTDQEYEVEIIAKLNRWLARGDCVAVYRNMDLGSSTVGHVKMFSFGSPEAQFEDDPPDQLPDGLPVGEINWRYRLEAVYQGDPFKVMECSNCGGVINLDTGEHIWRGVR